MYNLGIPRHTRSMIANRILTILSISGNYSEKLHCGSVVNMPYSLSSPHASSKVLELLTLWLVELSRSRHLES